MILVQPSWAACKEPYFTGAKNIQPIRTWIVRDYFVVHLKDASFNFNHLHNITTSTNLGQPGFQFIHIYNYLFQLFICIINPQRIISFHFINIVPATRSGDRSDFQQRITSNLTFCMLLLHTLIERRPFIGQSNDHKMLCQSSNLSLPSEAWPSTRRHHFL